MHEQIARVLYYLLVHLLYASMVWLTAWIVTSIRSGSATTKYWIWVATSLNFILPVGAILDRIGASHLSWARPLGAIGDIGLRIAQSPWVGVLTVTWLVGAALMATRLWLRLRVERHNARAISPGSAQGDTRTFLAEGVPVCFANNTRVPAVHGVLHPHITLPDGIDRLLSAQELNAVLAHELTHATRRDNLICLVHQLVLCCLWFHPLVWVTGSRLALYRELSCDEPVIQSARGRELISALAKLAHPERGFLLEATASSFLGHRLARLSARPRRRYRVASALLAILFAAVLVGSIFETVAHTACCFVDGK
jgi:beta-lactamase regulating signal transducer with metallopeptidase domain